MRYPYRENVSSWLPQHTSGSHYVFNSFAKKDHLDSLQSIISQHDNSQQRKKEQNYETIDSAFSGQSIEFEDILNTKYTTVIVLVNVIGLHIMQPNVIQWMLTRELTHW